MAENQSQISALFRDATPQDRAETTRLWADCGLTRPWNDPELDFDFAIAGPSSTVIVGSIDARIVASAMVGHDGHRGVVYYVSVHPDQQGQTLGAQLMAEAERWLKSRAVLKMNLIVRGGNEKAIGFYEALGYCVEPNTQMSKRLGGN